MLFNHCAIPVHYAFANSFFITFFGTLFSLLFTGTLAYALSKKYLPYRTALTAVFLASMFFGGGLIPSYLLVTALGLKNSLWAVMIPSFLNAWYALLLRNFFMQIPQEVEESAYIDGANDLVVFARIALPMSLPAIATIGLFYAVGFWNSWFAASIYLTDQSKWPLQLIGGTSWSLHDSTKMIYKADVGSLNTRQLYVNGKRATRAKGEVFPAGFVRTAAGYTLPAAGSYADMANWNNISDIEMVIFYQWKSLRCPVASITGTTLIMQQPCWDLLAPATTAPYPTWAENAYELLDEDGEWYLDLTGAIDGNAGTLYYKPREGESMSTADVAAIQD